MTLSRSAQLLDCRVLIVEDDYFVATELAGVLALHGAQVIGPVSSIEDGRRLVDEHAPHCVLLDIDLRGERTLELAQELRARGVFIIFTTGFDDTVLPPQLQDLQFVRKPVDVATLLELIRNGVRRGAGA